MIENPMVIDSLWPDKYDRPDHWNEDRTDEMVMEFADDGMAVDAMKYWLRLWRDFDEDRLLELFEAVSLNKQCEILTEYIDGNLNVQDSFDQWWEVKYNGDYSNDYDYESDWAWRD